MKLINISIISFLGVLFLYYGKFFLVPFFISLFLYIILNSLSKSLTKFAEKFGFSLNDLLSSLVIFCISLVTIYFLFKVLKSNLFQVKENAEIYQQNFNSILLLFSDETFNQFFSSNNILDNLNLVKLFTGIFNLLTSLAGNFSLVFIYLIFFAIEDKFFRRKIEQVFVRKEKLKVISNINNDIYNYFQIKAFTSFLTSFLTFLILYFLKNDLAISFAILAFFLNFIPYLGSLISILLPVIFITIQTLDFFSPTFTLALLLFTHILIGNFLETKLMGKTLNVSPIIILIFLSIMGKLWGLSGMFLSVPILVVILIILSSFKQTKKIAILISEKGNLNN